ncbi:MAG: TrkA family potassium uptake protein [Chloroflexota bacterium]
MGRRAEVYVVVIGGGNVGYYLTKELLAAGHEVVMIERDAARARTIADELGSIVIPNDGCEGRYQAEAGMARADVVAAVTGDDEDNLVACQVAKMKFNVPRAIARVSNPSNEPLFRRLAIDETVSATRSILSLIEHEIPIHDLLHLAELEGGEVQVVEAQLDATSPVIGKTLRDLLLPDGSTVAVIVRDEHAIAARPDTTLRQGDKLLAITSAEHEAELRMLLIGE